MEQSINTITPLNFSDVIDSDFSWDAVYKEYGIAFRDGVTHFFTQDNVWEIKMVVFIVCLQGQLSCCSSGKSLTLDRGKVMIHLPGSIVSDWVISPDFQCRVWCLSPEVFKHHAAETGFFDAMFHVKENPIREINNSESSRLMDAYATIFTIKSKNPDQAHVRNIIPHLIECLLYEMLSGIPITDTKELRQKYSSKYALFNRFVELVARDNGTSRSVKKYAEKLNISPKYLSAVCKSISGKSAYGWINDILKKEIERLLQYTDMSAKEISDHLEFPHPSLFSKYMRQHFNMTAIQYRTKARSI